MGTNYYCTSPDEGEPLHIGKSSSGWCFSLHVIPERELNSLEDWKAYLSKPGIEIVNEYEDRLTLDALLKIITERGRTTRDFPTPQWFSQNHAVPGPNGLARHALDWHCVGHGAGTWDLITGVFS